jgi:hypothetical protein
MFPILRRSCSVPVTSFAEPRAVGRGAEIKLLPGAGAEIVALFCSHSFHKIIKFFDQVQYSQSIDKELIYFGHNIFFI